MTIDEDDWQPWMTLHNDGWLRLSLVLGRRQLDGTVRMFQADCSIWRPTFDHIHRRSGSWQLALPLGRLGVLTNGEIWKQGHSSPAFVWCFVPFPPHQWGAAEETGNLRCRSDWYCHERKDYKFNNFKAHWTNIGLEERARGQHKRLHPESSAMWLRMVKHACSKCRAMHCAQESA